MDNFTQNRKLRIQALESRRLLTTIQVVASGQVGDETFEVRQNDRVIQSFQLTKTTPQVFTVQTLDDLEINDLRIAFTNDAFDPVTQEDRNLIVDKVIVDSVELETEDPSTFSTSSFVPELAAIVPGFWQSETLNTDGYFAFRDPSLSSPGNSVSASSTIVVRALGDEGTEQFSILVDQTPVATFNVSTTLAEYVYQHSTEVTPEQIRVDYQGDIFDVANGIDTNMYVDYIKIDDVIYETESKNTFSTGVWRPEDGIAPGFGRGPKLNADGYFQYASGATIELSATGAVGGEAFDVRVGHDVVATFNVTSAPSSFSFQVDRDVRPRDVRIEFAPDANSPGSALTIDWLEINGERFETEDPTTFSVGSSVVAGSPVVGFTESDTLVTDGFIQYRALPIRDLEFQVAQDSGPVPIAPLTEPVAEGYFFSISDNSLPTNGTLEVVQDQFFYTPDSGFTGDDSFTFQIASPLGAVNQTATVNITITESHGQLQNEVNSDIPATLAPSGKTLVIEKFAKLPRGDRARHLRMNSMTTMGDRIFVVDDGGRLGEGKIYELVDNGSKLRTAELFFDAGAAIFANSGLYIDNSSPLNGLRSVAFHPEFQSNGKFYTTFTGQRPADPSGFFYLSDPPVPVDIESVLVEWTFDFANNRVDENSYREVFRVGMFNSEHAIRNAVFNKFAVPGDEDYGLLYIGHGDGSEQSAIAGDGQQNDALGKILRIDPLQNGTQNYGIPATNPYVGDGSILDEVYAIGFRNPHNLSFARSPSGEIQLLVTEIGRDNLEEINIVVPGGNYGWADREGVLEHLRDQPVATGTVGPLPSNDAQNDYIYPVAIYGHGGVSGQTVFGQAIAGGHVIQNGSTELNDQFVFVEFSTEGKAYHFDFSDAQQLVTTLDPNDPSRDEPDELSWINPSELTILFDHDNDPNTTALVKDSLKDVLDDEPDFERILTSGKVRADLRLGEGPDGELLILNKRNGWVYRATNTVAPNNQTFVVTQPNDELDPTDTDLRTFDPGDLSLREAISLANIDPTTTNRIHFDFASTGVTVISPTSPLPTITGPVVMDGSTQPGFAGTPTIRIDGSSAGSGVSGLKLQNIGSTVSHLSVTGFSADAIQLVDGGSHFISQNFLGLNHLQNPVANQFGLRIQNSASNLVDANVIAGNSGSGVVVNGPTSIANTFVSNLVGINRSNQSRPNGGAGILIRSPENIVGQPGAGNTVNGNSSVGVSLTTDANRTIVQANSIQANSFGIRVASDDNQIGGSGANEGNVISRNDRHGILFVGADDNVVQGNRIGTSQAGNAAIGNGSYGILAMNLSGLQLGGDQPGESNRIAANQRSGIVLTNVDDSVISGNVVGLSGNGENPLPNIGAGIQLTGGSERNFLSENHIASNTASGIMISGINSVNNTLASNLVGTNASATSSILGGPFGILVSAPQNVIGGEGNGNTIAGATRGIVLSSSAATGNTVSHNFVGTDRTRAADFGMPTGVQAIKNAANNQVSDNVIANNQRGVWLVSSAGSGNQIRANKFIANDVIEIDLNVPGVSPNDPGDIDESANRGQNSPELLNAQLDDGIVSIDVVVPTPEASAVYDLSIEVYVTNPTSQSRTPLLVAPYSASSAEQIATIQITDATALGLSEGDTLSAIATDSENNTSEFSNLIQIITVSQASSAPPAAPSQMDVNQDGIVSALDAINIINQLGNDENAEGESPRSEKYDVDGDGQSTAKDALRIINWLAKTRRTRSINPSVTDQIDLAFASLDEESQS